MIIDNDAESMLAFKAGDENAFKTLLDKFGSPIINFAYRFTGNRTDAEDIAQEVFLRVYRSAGSYEPRAKFSTWLYRIAANACLDYKKKRRTDVLGGAVQIMGVDGYGEQREIQIAEPAEKSAENLTEKNETGSRILSALAVLPEKQRIVLNLRIFEDKSYEEIADILSCSVSKVESLLFRARQTLKNKLKDFGK